MASPSWTPVARRQRVAASTCPCAWSTTARASSPSPRPPPRASRRRTRASPLPAAAHPVVARRRRVLVAMSLRSRGRGAVSADGASVLDVPAALADCLGLAAGTLVRVAGRPMAPVAASVDVAPERESDWNAVVRASADVERNLLRQIGVAREGQAFPFYPTSGFGTPDGAPIRLRGGGVSPSAPGGVAGIGLETELRSRPGRRIPLRTAETERRETNGDGATEETPVGDAENLRGDETLRRRRDGVLRRVRRLGRRDDAPRVDVPRRRGGVAARGAPRGGRLRGELGGLRGGLLLRRLLRRRLRRRRRRRARSRLRRRSATTFRARRPVGSSEVRVLGEASPGAVRPVVPVGRRCSASARRRRWRGATSRSRRRSATASASRGANASPCEPSGQVLQPGAASPEGSGFGTRARSASPRLRDAPETTPRAPDKSRRGVRRGGFFFRRRTRFPGPSDPRRGASRGARPSRARRVRLGLEPRGARVLRAVLATQARFASSSSDPRSSARSGAVAISAGTVVDATRRRRRVVRGGGARPGRRRARRRGGLFLPDEATERDVLVELGAPLFVERGSVSFARRDDAGSRRRLEVLGVPPAVGCVDPAIAGEEAVPSAAPRAPSLLRPKASSPPTLPALRRPGRVTPWPAPEAFRHLAGVLRTPRGARRRVHPLGSPRERRVGDGASRRPATPRRPRDARGGGDGGLRVDSFGRGRLGAVSTPPTGDPARRSERFAPRFAKPRSARPPSSR